MIFREIPFAVITIKSHQIHDETHRSSYRFSRRFPLSSVASLGAALCQLSSVEIAPQEGGIVQDGAWQMPKWILLAKIIKIHTYMNICIYGI